MLAYSSVRASLARQAAIESGPGATHWEFLAACREDGLEAETLDRLTSLTEAYERAAYAPDSMDPDEGAAVIATVEGLL